MKDNRFIELVNLYVDRQISAEETAELETEMQANPRRRAIYRQYCQLHTATKQVYDSFRVNAEPQSARPTGRAVVTQFKSRSRSNWIHYAGGLAAAACLTVAFVRYNSASQPVTESVAQSAPTPAMVEVAPVAPVAPTAVVAAAPVAEAPAPNLISLRNNLTVEPNYSEMLANLRREEQRAYANGEIQSSRLPSLFDDGVFEVRSGLPVNTQRSFRSQTMPGQATVQTTSFEFQR